MEISLWITYKQVLILKFDSFDWQFSYDSSKTILQRKKLRSSTQITNYHWYSVIKIFK